MFDDRIEVRSPGLPPQPVTVEALNRRERLHISRNPLIVRVLAELGYVRELGEGIPRMFDVMEQEGFYPPRFASIGGTSFEVTLRNQPIYDRATLEWLQQYKDLDLSGDQMRLLVYARAQGGAFTSRAYQKLVGIDPYGASLSIKGLTRTGVARSTGRGSRVYQIVEASTALPAHPPELTRLLPAFRERQEISNSDIRAVLDVRRHAATRVADALVKAGWLERTGFGRWTRYRLTGPAMTSSRYGRGQSGGGALPPEGRAEA